MSGRQGRPRRTHGPAQGEPTRGGGGPSRRGLRGRGPTPKAEDRTYHPAHKRKVQAQARQRAQRRRERQNTPQFEAVGGRNTVLEALRARVPVEEIYLARRIDADDRTREIIRIAANRQIPIHEVEKVDLDGFAHGTNHQGVIARIHPYEYDDAEDLLEAQTPLILALDGITDPHNLGAALRSASAFGADGVVIPSRRSASVNATAWKVSAGAAARVRVAQVTNLVRTLETYKKQGLFVVGLDAGGEATIEDFGLAAEPLVVVLGSEDKGLSRLVRETCDMIVSIPIRSEMESLNASVALGVTLYEVTRSRGKVET